ncbi:type I restriction enzyme R subunit [Anopheles sinensis]|uniref:Type I restriction enzyme R subunit n=1 Tax=Anopheles sinensis TaxID=74873 RepID=A0A084VPN8_ANOSI|nr:type I restriction enzyme R subunit [Anopheles sinensis]
MLTYSTTETEKKSNNSFLDTMAMDTTSSIEYDAILGFIAKGGLVEQAPKHITVLRECLIHLMPYDDEKEYALKYYRWLEH